jgi:hypothetical protein
MSGLKKSHTFLFMCDPSRFHPLSVIEEIECAREKREKDADTPLNGRQHRREFPKHLRSMSWGRTKLLILTK